jgi:hypothetical protein
MRTRTHKILSSFIFLSASIFWMWASDNLRGGKAIGMIITIPALIYFVYGNIDFFSWLFVNKTKDNRN